MFGIRWSPTDILRMLRYWPRRDGVVTLASDGTPLERLRKFTAVVDLRDTERGESVKRGRSKGTRAIGGIDAICLHQTAAPIAEASRFLSVPAHAAVLPDAKIVLLHPLTAYLWACHSGNRRAISIEISARADGIEGDPRTFWLSRRERKAGKTRESLRVEATDEQLEAAKYLCQYYVHEIKRLGGSIGHMMAHRQTHRSRVSDPGSRIWNGVAISIALQYGLHCGVDGFTMGSGKPIPRAWDPQCEASYSWRVK